MLEVISMGYRVEIGPGSVVLVGLIDDGMTEFRDITAAWEWVIERMGIEAERESTNR